MGRRYRPEFKQEAVNLVVRQGLPVKQAAADLGIGMSTLDNWLRRHREHEQDPNVLGETELEELRRLRKEVHLLRLERFFHTLKVELTHRQRYRTREEARKDIENDMHCFYNTKRRHSSLIIGVQTTMNTSTNLPRKNCPRNRGQITGGLA